MIQGKVLVTGATGDTGGATVDELLARGHHVRALARKPDERSKRLQDCGVEVVFGDLLDFNAMRAALDGSQRAYFVYPLRPGIVQATAQFAQAAKEAGVDGIVNMSQISAREDAKSHAATLHWLSERVFDWSGLAVAHIRPTYFAEWLLYVAPMIRKGLLHVPFGTGRHAPITADDMGRVIVGILEDPESHRDQAYPLYGPVEYSYAEIAQVLSRVLGKEIEYKQVEFEEFKQTLHAGGKTSARGQPSRTLSAESERTAEQKAGDEFLFQHLHEVAIDHQNGIFAGTNDLVEKIGGRPPMMLEAFIEKHRAAFV
jgi:NAD(P)H dehydrogenase (quinone)